MKRLYPIIFLFTALSGIAQPQQPAIAVLPDITYYQGPDYDSANHKLNLVIPEDVADPPLLVWIGGGAWSKVENFDTPSLLILDRDILRNHLFFEEAVGDSEVTRVQAHKLVQLRTWGSVSCGNQQVSGYYHSLH